MSVSVKRITLWRSEVKNVPGVLASTLASFAAAGADLQVVMGYRYPGDESKAAIELYPVSGKKLVGAAKSAGLSASAIPTLLVTGKNEPGLGYVIAQALADAGINLGFLVAQVVKKRCTATIGFGSEADAKKATSLIKKATKKR